MLQGETVGKTEKKKDKRRADDVLLLDPTSKPAGRRLKKKMSQDKEGYALALLTRQWRVRAWGRVAKKKCGGKLLGRETQEKATLYEKEKEKVQASGGPQCEGWGHKPVRTCQRKGHEKRVRQGIGQSGALPFWWPRPKMGEKEPVKENHKKKKGNYLAERCGCWSLKWCRGSVGYLTPLVDCLPKKQQLLDIGKGRSKP